MSVTDNRPTKVGQRVQEIYSDTRGWVIELGRHGGEDMAIVDWDDKPVGSEDELFPLDALRVVEVIRCDLDQFTDPGISPLVEMVSLADSAPDLDHARYRFTDGEVVVGIAAARLALLKRSVSSRGN